MKNNDKKYEYLYRTYAMCGLGCALIPFCAYLDINRVISVLTGTCFFLYSSALNNSKAQKKLLLRSSAFGLVMSAILCNSVLTNTQGIAKIIPMLWVVSLASVYGLGMVAYFKEELADNIKKYAYHVSYILWFLPFVCMMQEDNPSSTIMYIILSFIILICMLPMPKKVIKKLKEEENISAKDSSDKINKLTQLNNLLDSGVITQEEFDEKKKQLLNL